MVNVNIVFDGFFDDADIIAVPDDVVSGLDEIVKEFFNWITTTKDNDYSLVAENRKYLVAETDGFIKWLNLYYCKKEKAFVVERNTKYSPKYKIIEF